MKLLLINSVCGIGSTGRLCVDIAKAYEKDGYEVKIAYGRSAYVPEECYKYAVRIGSNIDTYLHALGTRITDRHGLFSKRATKQFLEWADEFDPDMVWLHNIHGYYINYEMLFDWIKSRPNLKVRWTLHDCWTFTGHCAHYTYVGCDKWICKTDDSNDINNDPNGGSCRNCCHCPQKREYPSSYFLSGSKDNFTRKRKAFLGVKDMTLITPSKWLSGEVAKSYLKTYPIEVVHNEIDRSIFKHVESRFRTEHKIMPGEKIVLAVAGTWTGRKGLGDLIELNKRLNADTFEYKMVIVGLSDDQIKKLSASLFNAILIARTNSTQELVEIYSAADVFVNPTYEDNYPTVNLEAEACGVKVITYDTGGCSETINNPDSQIIPQGVDHLYDAVVNTVFGKR